MASLEEEFKVEPTGPQSDSAGEEIKEEMTECDSEPPRRRTRHQKTANVTTFKCIYCRKATMQNSKQLRVHIDRKHIHEKIKCSFFACPTYFKTKDDKLEHEKAVHLEAEARIMCIYCKIFPKFLQMHISRHHRGVAIKCRKYGCSVFFLTEEERDLHHTKVHEPPPTVPAEETICDISGKEHRLEKPDLSDKTCECVYCGENVALPTLWEHVKDVHPGDAIKCSTFDCLTYFKTEEERLEHEGKFHEKVKERFLCIYCKKIIRGQKPSFHVRQFHKDEAIRCGIKNCYTYFLNDEEREQHEEEVHGFRKNPVDEGEGAGSQEVFSQNLVSCPYCNRKVTTSAVLREHIKCMHPGLGIRCSYNLCSTWFKTNEEKAEHEEKVHAGNEKNILCVYCNQYSRHMNFKVHIMRYHKDVAIRCSRRMCMTYFLTYEEKAKHMKEVHKPKPRKKIARNFVCPCGTVFKDKPRLALHIKKQHQDWASSSTCDEEKIANFIEKEMKKKKNVGSSEIEESGSSRKKFDCMFCDSKLSHLSYLRTHIRNFHSDVAFQCEMQYCSQYFKSQLDVEDHYLEKHASMENFKKLSCAHCSYRSHGKTILANHMTSKHFPRSLKCHLCFKVLRTRARLKGHIQKVHTERKACPHCAKIFSPGYLKLHLAVQTCLICKEKFECIGMRRRHTELCDPNKPVFYSFE